MFDFIKNNFFHFDEHTKKIVDNTNIGELYEKNLYIQFGNCKEYTSYGINILFITDTHNCLAYSDKYLNYIKSLKATDYDICLILGDVSSLDIDAIKSIIPKEKLFGIAGNHDSINIMDANNITNIHGKVIECKGIKIAAMMGSNRYKQGDYGMITQDESIQIAKSMETADILVTTQNREYIGSYMSLAKKLRKAGLKTEIYLQDKGLGAQLTYASKKGIKLVLIANELELLDERAIIRNLQTKEQKIIRTQFIGHDVADMLK